MSNGADENDSRELWHIIRRDQDRKMPNLYVVYDHPKDFPDEVVVRLWHGTNSEYTATEQLVLRRKDIDTVRMFMLEHGLYRLPRNAVDDPKILETWI